MNPGPPALEASTTPLGYRGGGNSYNKVKGLFEKKTFPNAFKQIKEKAYGNEDGNIFVISKTENRPETTGSLEHV